MKRIKDKIITLGLILMLTIPSLVIFSPQKAQAQVVTMCVFDPSHICFVDDGVIVLGRVVVVLQ